MITQCITSLKICVRYWKCCLKALLQPGDEIAFAPDKKYAFVMLSANYNNLGDIAITKAQIDFLKRNLPQEYQIIEIPHDAVYSSYKSIRKHIDQTSLITLIGGGNSGTLYEFVEGPRRFILKKFRKNHIVSFPQSVYYAQDEQGMAYQKAFEKAARRCADLTLVAREQRSYEWYRSMMQGSDVKVLMTPDIVLSMQPQLNTARSNTVSVILRNDKEKTQYPNLESAFRQAITDCDCTFVPRDTCDVDVSEDRFGVLQDYLRKIGESKLVITDRLHGMIFSYITGTPCIVFDNNNHKIESTVKTWLGEQESVDLCGASTDLRKEIAKMLSMHPGSNRNGADLAEKYQPLVTALHRCVSSENEGEA